MSSFPLDGCSLNQQQEQPKQQEIKLISKMFIDDNFLMNQQCSSCSRKDSSRNDNFYNSTPILNYNDDFQNQVNDTQQNSKQQQNYNHNYCDCQFQPQNQQQHNFFEQTTLAPHYHPSTSHQPIMLPTLSTGSTASRSVLPNVDNKVIPQQSYAPISDTLLLALRRSQPNTR